MKGVRDATQNKWIAFCVGQPEAPSLCGDCDSAFEVSATNYDGRINRSEIDGSAKKDYYHLYQRKRILITHDLFYYLFVPDIDE